MARGSAKKRRQRRSLAAASAAAAGHDGEAGKPRQDAADVDEDHGEPEADPSSGEVEPCLKEDEAGQRGDDSTDADTDGTRSAKGNSSAEASKTSEEKSKEAMIHENGTTENGNGALTPSTPPIVNVPTDKLQGLTPEDRAGLPNAASNSQSLAGARSASSSVSSASRSRPLGASFDAADVANGGGATGNGAHFIGSISSNPGSGSVLVPPLPATDGDAGLSQANGKAASGSSNCGVTGTKDQSIDPSEVKPLTSPVSMASRFVQPRSRPCGGSDDCLLHATNTHASPALTGAKLDILNAHRPAMYAQNSWAPPAPTVTLLDAATASALNSGKETAAVHAGSPAAPAVAPAARPRETSRFSRADSTSDQGQFPSGAGSASLAVATEEVIAAQNAAAAAEAAAAAAVAAAGGPEADEAAAAAAAALPEDDFIRYYVKEDDPSEDLDGGSPVSFFDWVWQDLGFETEEDQAFSSKNASVEDDVFNFIRVPLEVEKLLIFGFFLCCDSLLFVLVYLPVRVVRALFLLVCTLIVPSRYGAHFKFHRTQLYDLLRASIIAIAFAVLLQVHMSRIYHYVRGQAFIKLYVIFNMLDIFDRLMCSFGQDIMDSLFYMTKTSPRAYGRIFFRFILGICYVTAHSLLYFVRLITLNAAINSTSNALMTILISNNFVELKGSVFKRFAEQNLFQITCSDMVERFELFVFLVLTGLQSADTWFEFIYSSAAYVFVCEFLVDWIKHAFITKFNRIHFSCYGNFLEALCRDIAPVSNHKHPYATSQRLGGRPVDATQAVAQRIGLATLPLTCIVLRFVFVNMPHDLRENPFTVANILFVILSYGCLLAFKTFINIVLKGRACAVLMHRERKILSRSSPRLSNLPSTPTEKELQKALVAKHLQHIDQLSSIRRYQIFKSRIPT
ncbi:Transmembrane anterior posterior transformation protein 1-like [Hondaea fermentalgiana]|uniref:Transmembrane anterior posterior transformation protein 1-like n=1 Tax=Hondaea fermentalgiana TaxID=2315210 RepID=A0A2R5GBA1_9STRA|nr:Transmembrane anterior posterior transformation protein 1-like [Hondaea fermentalgiana]|eukprot:GBG25391.1 Transmembrane anterior posterior transformation protein 1-like [Hondaea fermentalgiana]